MEPRGVGRVQGGPVMMDGTRPCSAAVAVERALAIVGHGGAYALGTGNYDPHDGIDLPWTQRERDGRIGSDCAGFVCWAYKLKRHRPGFNKGGRFDVEDDINTNSMLGDAFGAGELFSHVTSKPEPGDMIAYPSFYLYDEHGNRRRDEHGISFHYIGHVGLVTGTDRVTADWNPNAPDWRQLDIAQCCGPDGRQPGVIASDGAAFFRHDTLWPKPEHRSWLLRIVP